MECLATLMLALAFVFAFSAAAAADQTPASCDPPSDVSGCQMQALTVLENPGNPTEPHPTVSGALITLGGIARYGGDEYMWDFGDGTTPSAWESITNPYDLGIKHVYVGAVGSLYLATLSVRDSANPSVVATAIYPVEIESAGTPLSDPAQLAVSARMAVDESLWYLHVSESRSQFGGGSPGYGQPFGYWDDLASTCLAVDTLEGHGSGPNGSDNDPYVEDVQRALAYIATQWDAIPISQTYGGDPDSNGNGIGLAIDAGTPAETYTSAVCAMALADSGDPNLIATTGGPGVFGRPYSAIAQDTVDWFAYSQNQLNSGPVAGSWGYEANTGFGTNEVTRWVILALEAAQKQMGATVPSFVPAAIPPYLNYTTDENPSSNYGGLGDFHAGDSLTGIGFTAGGIITDEFLGETSTSPSIEASLGYIYRHWNDNNGSSDTNLGDSDAMYSVMRALTGTSPAAAEVMNYDPFTGLPTGDSFDWYATPVGQAEEGYATNLIPRQQANGSWVDSTGTFGFHFGTVVADTALDTSILASSIPAAPTAQPTSTQLASTANPSAFSAPVTYTATVSVSAPGVGTPTGTVAFTDGGQPIAGCSAVTLSGTASLTAWCTTTPLSPGSHPVVATYSGDSNYATSFGSLSEVVNEAPVITSAASTTFTAGTAGSFTVATAAYPAAALSETGTLPSGVSFTFNSNGTATLAGTPAGGTGGIYPLTFIASNGVPPPGMQSFTLTVDEAPAITSGASATFTAGTAENFSVTTTGFPTPSFTEVGALPAGVSFTDNGNGTATLSGTPAAGSSGNYPVTITASNSVSPDATQSFALTVNQAPAITSSAAATFTVGTAGTFTVASSGNPPAGLTEAGTLPAGVSFTFNGNGTATLAGTPAGGTGGIYPLTFIASNGVPPPGMQSFTLTIDQAPAITSGASATFRVGTADNVTVQTTGFPTAALSETGMLPSGVTFTDNGNGTATLAGTAAAGSGGTYSLTITAANGVLPNATQSFTLTVDEAPAVTSRASTTFTVGSAGSFTVQTTGFPTASLAESGALPAGVTFTDDGTGTATLAGTPATGSGGIYPLTITAANGVSPNATQSFTLTVDQAPAITSPAGAAFTVGTAGTFTLKTSGFPAAALSESGKLPGGVAFVDNGDGTATLAGTPAEGSGGTYPITITAANGVSPNATQAFTLTVLKGQTVTFGSAPGSPVFGGHFRVRARSSVYSLPVTFVSATPSVCVLDTSYPVGPHSERVDFVGRGTCTIDASQAGTAVYAAASAQLSFTVAPADQSFHFTSSPGPHRVGDTYQPTASVGEAGNAAVFSIDPGSAGVCSLSEDGTTVTYLTTGACTIDATEAGNANYNPASRSQTVNVNTGAQAISFTSTPPANPTYGGSYVLSATGGASGNPVVYTVAPGSASNCSLGANGVTVSFVGAGNCTIRANQAGNANYDPAPQVTQSFAIAKASQMITVSSAPSSGTIGGSGSIVATGGGSGNPLTYKVDSSSTSGACKLSGSTVSYVKQGTCVIDINQTGNSNYTAAGQAQITITIGKQTAV